MTKIASSRKMIGILSTALLFPALSLAQVGVIAAATAKSDTAVIIAKPESFSKSADGMHIKLSVTEWLYLPSGSPGSPSPSVDALWPHFSNQSPPQPPYPVGMWFLFTGTNGNYRVWTLQGHPPGSFDSLYYPLPNRGKCPVELGYPPTAPPAEKIALELACAASVEPSSRRESGFVGATVGLADSSTVHNAFVYLSQLPGARQKAIGIASLIHAKDLSGIALLGQQYRALADEDVFAVVGGSLWGWKTPDPTAISTIGKIAVDPNSNLDLIRGAEKSLALIHTKSTIPYLARLLDAVALDVRIDAIYGITQFLYGRPIQTLQTLQDGSFMLGSPTPYVDDPTWKTHVPGRTASEAEVGPEIQFWKDWLKAHPELLQ